MPGCIRRNYSLGQKGTHQIAVSRVAAAPQGRSHLRGAIQSTGKSAPSPPTPPPIAFVPALTGLPGATTVSKSAPWCPTTHPHLQVALSVQKGLWKETVIPSYQFSGNRCCWGNNLLRFLFLFEIAKYNICIHMYT